MEKELFLGTAINGDCLDEMGYIPDKSIDMILCDLPYGTTQNKWDSVISFTELWGHYERIIKPGRAIVLTGAQPFTSALVMSNPKLFKWEDIWHKSQASGHLNAKIMPMREHENILIFGVGKVLYNPQISDRDLSNIRPQGKRGSSTNYGSFKETAERGIPLDKTYPRSVIKIGNSRALLKSFHPTQKPVALFEYLIKTYTNPGELVLDNCAGSFTTAIAAINAGRRYICIEKDEAYYNLGVNRIKDHSDFLL